MKCLRFIVTVGVIGSEIFVGLGSASAQMSQQERDKVSIAIAADINRALAGYPKEGIPFREKVVGRLTQCAYVFTLISKSTTDPEAKDKISDIARISSDLSARVSNGISTDRFKEIASAAQQSIKNKFSERRTEDTEREMNLLLKNCKSFHKADDVSGAVAALLPPSPQKDNAAAIEFANELQECSLYYTLLSGGLLVQVPRKSGSLSSADRDKVVRSQVYMTKAEQIEVLYKRLARLAGVTEDSLTARRDTMFEQVKRVMANRWDLARLDERYKEFCEYILSDTGGKARIQEITEGNVCGRLYTCW